MENTIVDSSGVIMNSGKFYPIELIKEFIPCLDDISHRLLYLRFNAQFLTPEEIANENRMIERLRMNKQAEESLVVEEFMKNEENSKGNIYGEQTDSVK